MALDLEAARKQCEMWEEEDGCLDDYDGEACPIAAACKRDAESES